MTTRIFTVKHVIPKTSFCYLSETNHTHIWGVGQAVLKLHYGNNCTAYFTSQVLTSLENNEIGLNQFQAGILELYEGCNVLAEVCFHVPYINSLTISPVSIDDYEILEIVAENVESTLLNQISVVNANQKFIIWITDSIRTVVDVDLVQPVSPGRLENLTKLIVKPPKLDKANMHSEIYTEWNVMDLFKRFAGISQNLIHSRDNTNCFNNLQQSRVFRMCSLNDINYKGNKIFTVFIKQQHYVKQDSLDVFNLNIIIPPSTNNVFENGTYSIKTINVHVSYVNDDVKVDDNSIPVLYVHDCIFQHFGINMGAKAYLQICTSKTSNLNSIEIKTTKEYQKSAIERFKLLINEAKELLLNSDIVMSCTFPFMLKFQPENATFCIADSEFIRNCNLTVSDLELHMENTKKNVENKFSYLTTYGNLDDIIKDSLLIFREFLNTPENALITGKPGTGKTTLVKILSKELYSSPLYIYSEIISCKSIKGKSLESLHKVFTSKILNLIYYQPSLLILDDLHIICEKVIDTDALTPEALHFNRVSEMLANLLENIIKHNNVKILATTESTLKLNGYIFASRGQHLFKNVFTVAELNKVDRISLLKYLFKEKSKYDIVLDYLAQKTEGFVVQDLADFVDKAIFECLKDEANIVTDEHCEKALQNTTALSLKHVQLRSPGNRDFSDIGGLDNVKKVLIECLMWPVQYSNIFAHAPLRLQSGLLLYGPPGTGKTILAGAAAKHCGLRLISIKGPELLSKYIGASEQSVRDVFENSECKTLYIIFDEFDSLAPRRGHDSTGVTDRVVNQLLTQLDGIESLSGVCVLAATSRPDLLDPALLRPGRLDRQILCPLPDAKARKQIMLVLSKNMNLADDVNLSKIAKETSGYSGADLQAILYTAQLSAVEDVVEELKGATEIEINQQQLVEALRNTRPSLTKEEKFKYERIYTKFQKGNDLVDIKSGIQKATLA